MHPTYFLALAAVVTGTAINAKSYPGGAVVNARDFAVTVPKAQHAPVAAELPQDLQRRAGKEGGGKGEEGKGKGKAGPTTTGGALAAKATGAGGAGAAGAGAAKATKAAARF